MNFDATTAKGSAFSRFFIAACAAAQEALTNLSVIISEP